MNRREAIKTIAGVSVAAVLLGKFGAEVTPTDQFDPARRATLHTFMEQIAPLALFEAPTPENVNEWERLLAAQFPGDKTAIVVADPDKAVLHFNVTYERAEGGCVLLVGQYESNSDAFVASVA